MTLKEQLEQAAAAGRQEKAEDEQRAEAERAAAELRRIAAEQANLTAAREELKTLPAQVQASVRKSENECTVHIIPAKDINFPREYGDGEPLDPSTLKGVSHHIFVLLQEEQLEPKVVVPCKGGLYLIKIPVPQAKA